MVMLVPLGIAALTGTAAIMQARRKKAAEAPSVAASRKVVFETALNEVKDPNKLRFLADAFEGEKMHAEANMLRKRASLQELPAETKEARREAFRKAMASTDVQAVLELANVFESEGATGAAENLRRYASGLAAKENSHAMP
jgi:hypothetical protein